MRMNLRHAAGLSGALALLSSCANPLIGGTDFHVHIHSNRVDDMEFDAKRAEIALVSSGFDRAVALSHSYQRFANPACWTVAREQCQVDRAWVEKTNDWTAAESKREKFRWRFFCGVPIDAPWAVEEMQRCRELGASGFKVHTQANGLRIDQEDVRKAVGDVLRAAEEMRLPVLLHASFPDAAQTSALIELVNAHPRACVIVGHALGKDWKRMTELTSPNAFVELSFAIMMMRKDPEAARDAIRGLGVGRVLFGSDWPVVHPQETLWALRQLGLDEVEVRRIVIENAGAVFDGQAH